MRETLSAMETLLTIVGLAGNTKYLHIHSPGGTFGVISL